MGHARPPSLPKPNRTKFRHRDHPSRARPKSVTTHLTLSGHAVQVHVPEPGVDQRPGGRGWAVEGGGAGMLKRHAGGPHQKKEKRERERERGREGGREGEEDRVLRSEMPPNDVHPRELSQPKALSTPSQSEKDRKSWIFLSSTLLLQDVQLVPGTHLTPVLMGQAHISGGWWSKIKVILVLGRLMSTDTPRLSTPQCWGVPAGTRSWRV